ncbi:MAG: secretin N-terminal domain-containing protein [Planctomycetota bacterium]
MKRSTILRLAIVALCACVLCGARVLAQGKPSADEVDPLAKPAAVPVKPMPATSVVDPKMPDISGTWRIGAAIMQVIRRVADGTADFVIDSARGDGTSRGFGGLPLGQKIKWSSDAQQFQTTIADLGGWGRADITLQLLADGKMMRVTHSFDEQRTAEFSKTSLLPLSEDGLKRFSIQNWTRQETPSPAAISSDEGPTTAVALQPSAPQTPLKEPPVTTAAQRTASETGQIKVFTLTNGSAVEYSKQLNDLSFNAKITADPRTNTVIVQSHDEEQLQIIEAILLRLDETPSKPAASKPDLHAEERQTMVFRLQNASAAETSGLLKDLSDDVTLVADTATNSLIVSSAGTQMKIITALLKKLDDSAAKPAAPKSDSTISFTRAPGPASVEMSSTPEARKLSENVAEHEAKARLLANEIRGLSQQLGPQHPKMVEARGQLEETLANALAAKFKLEQLQIQSLEERLTRLKSQIGQRQAVSKQIVERRIRELIDEDVLRWSPDASRINQDTSRNVRGETSPASKATTSRAANPQAKTLLAKARQAMNEGRLDEARQLAIEADQLKARYELFEDRPDLVLADLARDVKRSPDVPAGSDASRIHQDSGSKVRGESSSTSGAGRKTSSPDVHEDPLRSVSPYASYQDLAAKLAREHQNVVGWKHTVQETEQLVAKGEASSERLSQVRNNLNEALRKQKPILDEYAATLRDLELQIESAQIDVDAAKRDADRAAQLVKTGTTLAKVSDEAQRHLKQATLTLERLKVRYDLYKNAGEELKEGQSNAPNMVPLRDAMHPTTIDFPMANFPIIPGDRIEVQHALHAEEGFQGPAKTIASGLEVVGIARSLSTPTRTALTLVTTPEMAAMLEHLATTGLLFCHPLDPVAMLPCGRAVRIPLGIRQEGRLTVGDVVQVDRMSLAIGKNNLAEPKFTGFATGLLIGGEHGDVPEGTTEPTSIVKLLLPKDSNIDAHVFQNRVDELIRDGALFRGKMQERGDTTQFHVAVTEIEWQIESLEKRIAYYQAHVLNAAESDKAQLNLGYQRIRLEQLKAQQTLYKTSSDVMARVRPLDSAVNNEPSPP